MQVCPSLLLKKDRGRPTDAKAMPKAYGAVEVATNVPGAELLKDDNGNSDSDVDDGFVGSSETDDEDAGPTEEEGYDEGDDECASESDCNGSDSDDEDIPNEGSSSEDECLQEDVDSEDEDADISSENATSDDDQNGEAGEDDCVASSGPSSIAGDDVGHERGSKAGKRKFSDFGKQLNAANKSLRALKRLAGTRISNTTDTNDGILSNEDFQRIKQLKVW